MPIIILFLLALSFWAPIAVAQGQGGPAPVVTATVTSEKTRVWKAYKAELSAVDSVALRPQVGGTITEIRFQDGDDVKKGQVLFVIDPRPYQAARAQAQAALNAAQTQADLAQKELNRARDLIRTNAIAQRVLDERTNALKATLAQVDLAKAQLRQANINLDYAYVKAPIAGRTGRIEVTQGNLVASGPNAPVLTRIVAANPIYADFEVDDQTYLAIASQGEEAEIPVRLFIPGRDAPMRGSIFNFDNRIDPGTGTIRARAKFDNPDGLLLPGLFTTIELGSAEEKELLLVPSRAIAVDQDRRYVLKVVDGMATYQLVTLGKTQGDRRIVTSGLNEGDIVIAEGINRIRPGMPVQANNTQGQE